MDSKYNKEKKQIATFVLDLLWLQSISDVGLTGTRLFAYFRI